MTVLSIRTVATRPRDDEPTVRVEGRPDAGACDASPAGAALGKQIKDRTGVSVRVEVLAPDSIGRSLGKARRVLDMRPRS